MVVISNALKQYLMDKYELAEDKIQIARDAADIPNYELEPEKVNTNDRMQIGYLGHLYPGKGVELVYELSNLCLWADFHLVGGIEKDILFWKEKTRNAPNIFLHGWCVPAETEKLRAGFDVLLAPYQKKVGPSWR